MTKLKKVAVGLLCGLLLSAGGAGALESSPAPRIDINSASTAELASLPGIGPSKAQAIVDHRAKEPFATTDDLRNVKGIGDKLYESLRDRIRVGDANASPGSGG
jgi:competence protein ComEA